jgi:hypothetical protein
MPLAIAAVDHLPFAPLALPAANAIAVPPRG